MPTSHADDPAPSQGPAPERTRWLILALVGLLFLLHVSAAAGGVARDDAYISFRYARRFAEGLGLTYNDGARVEGYTNFSWVVLGALGALLGVDPKHTALALGPLSGVALVLLCARWGRELAEREDRAHRLAGLPAAVIVAASTSFAHYAGTGLETPLFALAMTGAGFALVTKRARAFAVWTAAAFLTRPEAGLLGVLGVAWLAVDTWRSRRPRPLLEAAGLLVVLVGPYLAFKLVYFGSLFPNTLAAKPPVIAQGLEYVLWYLPDVAAILVAVVAHGLAGGTRRFGLLGLWCAYAVAVVLSGGDFMHFKRLLMPSLGWLALAADGAILAGLRRPRGLRELLLGGASLLSLSYLPLSLLDLPDAMAWADGYRAIDEARAALVTRMRHAGVRSVATHDIGLIGYAAPDLAILDLAGLVEPEVARLPGSHREKRIPAELLAARDPDAVLITSRSPWSGGSPYEIDCHYPAEQHLVSLPWFREHYLPEGALAAGPGYDLKWYRRVR